MFDTNEYGEIASKQKHTKDYWYSYDLRKVKSALRQVLQNLTYFIRVKDKYTQNPLTVPNSLLRRNEKYGGFMLGNVLI